MKGPVAGGEMSSEVKTFVKTVLSGAEVRVRLKAHLKSMLLSKRTLRSFAKEKGKLGKYLLL